MAGVGTPRCGLHWQAWPGVAALGATRHGTAGQARQAAKCQGASLQGMERQARHVRAGHGQAPLGLVWQGRPVRACLGSAARGVAWPGRPGLARIGWTRFGVADEAEMTFRLNRFWITKADRPGGNRADTDVSTIGWRDSRTKRRPCNLLFAQSLSGRNRRAVPMSNRPVDIRGREVRRVLLSVVLRCAEHGWRLPQYRVLGAALGIDRSQVSRHLERLRAEGAYIELPAGHWRRRVTIHRNQHLRAAA